MAKKGKRILLLAAVVCLVWLGGLLADRQRLKEDILRLHVVAASDSEEDQAVKLRVRDVIVETLQQGLSDLTDMEQAKAYVEQMMPRLKEAADQVLADAGFSERVSVSLTEWAFPSRDYDTFSLPAGIYNALRVVIGEGEGQNWWCVVFPQLCFRASSEDFVEVSGFSDTLCDTLTGQYEIRFWLLDKIGQIENFLHGTSE